MKYHGELDLNKLSERWKAGGSGPAMPESVEYPTNA